VSRPPKYALDPALALREKRADDAARELGTKVRAREEAAAARVRAEAARARTAEEVAAARAAEHAALGRGELSVADLLRQDAWNVRVQMDKQALEAAERRATEAAATALRAETVARGELGARQADVEVVQKDRSSWQAREEKARQAKEEEAAADAWRPRRA
jgi:hypothetical protein